MSPPRPPRRLHPRRLPFSLHQHPPPDWFKAAEKARKITDLTYSGGFVLGKDGEVTEVAWDGPRLQRRPHRWLQAHRRHGRAPRNRPAQSRPQAKKSPLHLLVRTGDVFRTIDLHYDGGLRYPRLEKTNPAPGSLDALLTAKP